MAALTPRASRVFGCAHAATALLVVIGVFWALPERWWPVDLPASLLALGLGASALGLLLRTSWAERVARLASLAALVVGALLVGLLAVTASHLAGLYGPVGQGGALILGLVAALALPYLIVLPAVMLAWLSESK